MRTEPRLGPRPHAQLTITAYPAGTPAGQQDCGQIIDKHVTRLVVTF